jgi:hypothetical protein
VNAADRSLLRELRTVLLHLHKTLIDWQRREYELDRGALQTPQLLQVILNDEAFAWLRMMSGLIVRIDETLEVEAPEAVAIAPLIAQARELASPLPGSRYAERYHAALQELPDAVLAHHDLVTLLKGV